MSNYHNTHWNMFYKHSIFSAPVSVAVNCFTFDALSCLSPESGPPSLYVFCYSFDVVDNLNTTQTLECTKDKYNAKMKSERVSPKVSPTTYVGRRVKGRRSEGVEWIITR
jgi:hypothetical protein